MINPECLLGRNRQYYSDLQTLSDLQDLFQKMKRYPLHNIRWRLKVRDYAHSADKRRQNQNYKKDLCLLIKLSLKNYIPAYAGMTEHLLLLSFPRRLESRISKANSSFWLSLI